MHLGRDGYVLSLLLVSVGSIAPLGYFVYRDLVAGEAAPTAARS